MNEGNISLAKKLNKIAYVISIVVLLFVLMMRRIKIETDIDFSFLPAFHSSLNALTAILLIIAFVLIRQKKITAHKNIMFAAMITSSLFLLSYVTYHITTPETLYCGVGSIRIVYFILLISHVILAAVIFPFILFTLIRGYTMQVEKHKKMAKWVFPLWLYVAITGPILFLMLQPCYNL